jgi:Asp-tRNA(Asn)/Glu-tRNA(Gln) amidotransferase A subunit family amidase
VSGRDRSATGMAEALRAGDVSSRELVAEALERAETWQPVTNAFSQVFADEALVRSAEADAAIARGESGPLLGVPVAVKELFDVRGTENSGCCAAYRGRISDRDARMVMRLRDAGAVIVGKANQHELAAGATNLVSACGATHNPWDPALITGGSSGGSGAAVASGVVPIALGSDTGGSIRMPSSFCGCWGLKPTTGRLSTSGMMPMAASLDCPGPMTSSAADLELAWHVMSGARERIVPEAPGSVAVLRGWFSQADPQQLAAVDAAAAALERLGATVTEQEVDSLDDIIPVWRGVAWAELADAHGDLLATASDLVSPPIRSSLERGSSYTTEQRSNARRRAEEIAELFAGYLTEADMLLAPTTPFPAPRADAETVEIAPGRQVDVHRGGPAWFTEPFNLAGLPVVAAPAGVSREGLPLSVSLIGARDADERVLALALMLEGRDERFHARVAPLPEGMEAIEPPLGGGT